MVVPDIVQLLIVVRQFVRVASRIHIIICVLVQQLHLVSVGGQHQAMQHVTVVQRIRRSAIVNVMNVDQIVLLCGLLPLSIVVGVRGQCQHVVKKQIWSIKLV